MFQTVLIANRGEIAVRIIRTLRHLGIRSVAVYSDADAQAPHVRAADSALRLGPARASESYLDGERVIDAATRSGADAIHPGYGFLSENAEFAAACAAAGLVYIGPDPRATEIMGDKIRAKQRVEADGVPGIPGRAVPGMTDEELMAAANEIGFPVLIKPSAGGGGKGMVDVHGAADMPEALRAARRVAQAAFGDDTLFIERLITSPRHIEVQILADTHGTVIHLGERECSLQRRHQKVVEEAPSALLDASTRARIGNAACDVARSVDYTGAGTVEFLVSADAPDEFFFMEMNTRLQVEHPVTEAVTGVDLVEQQLRIAAGESLAITQHDISLTGHAVEARLYAEDAQFLPQAGTVEYVAFPHDVRVDSGIDEGTVIGSDYDPMLAKIIAHDETRDKALDRLARALEATVVLGVTTNTSFLHRLVCDADVRAGTMDTTTIDNRLAGGVDSAVPERAWLSAALVAHEARWEHAGQGLWTEPSGWRLGASSRAMETRMLVGDDDRTVTVSGRPQDARVEDRAAELSGAGRTRQVMIDGETSHVTIGRIGTTTWLHDGHEARAFSIIDRDGARAASLDGDLAAPELRSPMPGTVVAVPVADGDTVDAGDTVVVIEAMKMEHRMVAPVTGTVTLAASVNQTVAKDAIVATIVAAESADSADSTEESHKDTQHKGDYA